MAAVVHGAGAGRIGMSKTGLRGAGASKIGIRGAGKLGMRRQVVRE